MAKPTAILAAAYLGLQLGISQVAFAEGAYRSRPITIINPFPPGGTSAIVTRPLAAALEPIIKQPVVIETKAGAAGAVGAQFVASGFSLRSEFPATSYHIYETPCGGRHTRNSSRARSRTWDWIWPISISRTHQILGR